MGCCGKYRQYWSFGLAAIFAALGITIIFLWPNIAENIRTQRLLLKEGTDAYENWQETPVPLYLEFYVFNWTNPEEIRNPNVKPHMVEMGPYVYLEKHIKENITFYENGTLAYYQRRVWHFQPDLSNGTEEDMVTAAHAITATVADIMRHKSKVVKKVVNFMLNREGGMLHVTKPVGEWIFAGYKDRLIDFLNLFNSTKINLPYKRFAWLADRNNSLTYDGRFLINSGVQDITQLGHITHWNGKTESGFYPPPCGRVNGTAGDAFPPNLDPNAELTIFVTDACRYLNLKPTGTVEYMGLTGTQWEGTNETLDSGENFKPQECFCNKDVMDKCPLTGVVECKKCRYKAPIYASFPHFYLADPIYQNGVTGLNPQADLHKLTLALEPTLGIPLEVRARLQINMMITPDNDIDIYRGVPQVLMPMFWFEQRAALNDKLASKAKLALNLGLYGIYVAIAITVVGSLLFVLGIVFVVRSRRTPNATDGHVDDDDVDILPTNAAPTAAD